MVPHRRFAISARPRLNGIPFGQIKGVVIHRNVRSPSSLREILIEIRDDFTWCLAKEAFGGQKVVAQKVFAENGLRPRCQRFSKTSL